MLIKDKDILVETTEKKVDIDKELLKVRKENIRHAWGDAFDAYLRGITEKYLSFHGRASRLEFWGFSAAAGLVSIPLYVLGHYIDMPELPYYFAGATLIPFAAVTSRRIHDGNRKAAPYFISAFIPPASFFFIGSYAVLLFIVWVIMMVYVLSQPSDENDTLYGEAEEDDIFYGSDHQAIISKFRTIALMMLFIWLGVSVVKFDDWSRQAQQTAAMGDIMDKMEDAGLNAGLTPQQLKKAETLMKEALRAKNGQVVSPQEIQTQINTIIKILMAQ